MSGNAPRLFVTAAAAAVLAACQAAPPAQRPADARPAPPPAEPVRREAPQPAPPRAPLEQADEAPSSTVTLALLDNADHLAARGQAAEAVETLERAIRIEPRRGDLWLRLAQLQYDAGQFALAEQNARKGLLFLAPGGDGERQAWLLIAAALEARGDIEGADRIRRRWDLLRG